MITGEPRCLESGHVRFGGRPHGKGPAQQAPRRAAHPTEFGKDHFGLDQTQVRRYTALQRHIVLTMAALAVCAVTAAQARTIAPKPVLPRSSDETPPADTGVIALTVAEIKRLLSLATRRLHGQAHHLHRAWWRRHHQARARWFHHRTRLARNTTP